MLMRNYFVFPGNSGALQKKYFRAGVAYWVLLILVIGVLVARNPMASNVTWYYHEASGNWMARMDMYSRGHLGMNYLPHFAILFTLFDMLPLPAGDLLWETGSIVLFVTGIWRLAKSMFGDAARPLFLWITLFTVPLSAAAMRNGQANTLLAALMLHATAFLARKNWWAAAGFILLAVIAKPVAIVLLPLAVVVYRRLWLPVAFLAAVMAVFPYLFARPDYVSSQYHAFWINLQSCAVVDTHEYADITGILFPLHIRLSPAASQIIRALAGMVTLCLWIWGAWKLEEPFRALWLLTLAAAYLMLFNPMNESNSYVVLAPVMALWAVLFLVRGWWLWGWGIAVMVLSMGLLPNLFRPVFGNHLALFYHPAMTFLFLAVVIAGISRYGVRTPDSARREGSGIDE